MVLGRGQYYCISLCEEKHSIQLSFILLQVGGHSALQRIDLFQYFQSELEQLMEEFMNAASKPIAYIPCCYCNELHIEMQLLLEGEQQHCHTRQQPVPDKYYHELIVDQGLYCHCDNSYSYN